MKIISYLLILAVAQAEPFFRKPSSDLSFEPSIKALKRQLEVDKSPVNQAKTAFAIGVFFYKSEDKSKSREFFEYSLKNNTRLSDYAHFFLGLLDAENQNFEEAKKHFNAVINTQPRSVRKVEAELQLALIARQEERWGEALRLLKILERKYRRDIQHSDILINYFEVAQSKKNKSESCNAALKLYTKYPLQTVVLGWPTDLSNVGCAIRIRDQERRFTQLLLSAEFDQVRKEVKFWTEKLRVDNNAHPTETGFYETQLGRVNLSEGKVAEAITNFNTAQDVLGKNFNVQMMLGKAYSQTENYAAAIEAYMGAHDMSPSSKNGKFALFQAAFLSYQNRDYDGAARRFEQLTKKARGKILWDTKWHLAWIRYLKEDYSGALKAFNEMGASKKAQKVDKEKMIYWKAMCNMKMGFIEEAEHLFGQLTVQRRMGYYTAAAFARIALLPSRPAFISPTASKVEPRGPSSEAAPEPDSLEEPQQDIADEDSTDTASEGTDEVVSASTTLKDPKLALRFDKAKDLIDLGFDVWARAELREIEKHTRNQNYLQLLMTEYAKAGEYNRSAYIADVIFSQTRESGGLEGAHLFWIHAYPLAYEKLVNKSADKFDVRASLIWSVMRGESAFKEDIHSSAGALGLMQMIPKTGKRIAENLDYKDFKKESLIEPETNIRFGTWYLKRLSKAMLENLPLVVASYNAGPHRVKGWLKEFGNLDMDEFIEHIPYIETRNYVKKILRNYFIYEALYQKKRNALSWLPGKFTIKFDGPKPSVENWND